MFRKIALLALVFTLATASIALAKDYGKGISLSEVTKISQIQENPDAYVGKIVLIEGPIIAVCRSRGCWMEIASDREFEKFRIKVEDGVMVFPMSARGKVAKVQGKVERVFFRCSDEVKDKKDHKKKEGPYYQLRASGAEIL